MQPLFYVADEGAKSAMKSRLKKQGKDGRVRQAGKKAGQKGDGNMNTPQHPRHATKKGATRVWLATRATVRAS
jgi:hypothetical protein